MTDIADRTHPPDDVGGDEQIGEEARYRASVTAGGSETSAEIGELAAALAMAQGEMTGALKGTENSFFKSKYADLAACWDAARGPLSKHGLAVIQTTELCETGIVVVTTLAHKSGQWIRGRLRMCPEKNTPQGIGSAITYARRYGLTAMVGVAQMDDDGEAAMGRNEKKAPAVKPLTANEKADAEALAEDVEAFRAWWQGLTPALRGRYTADEAWWAGLKAKGKARAA